MGYDKPGAGQTGLFKKVVIFVWVRTVVAGSGLHGFSPNWVMCDAYTLAGKPIPTNKRCAAGKIFSNPEVEKEVPWYRIEQEYTVDVNWPLGWPQGGFPGPQGPYYCGIGTDKAFGHDIVDAHNKACLYAGINISGINGEVMSGQWEFQVGPAVGISVGG
ncbi:putative glutamine synthetase [Helianthus annuus]|nr:putative glutamine synthetase [Helianthus annuus]KAJ0517111.1 putative glutamine synthetase [Helianthus annuus]KAJ0685120.1 putative glutamine synthetase [Helianthus annuus]KAJ0689037.1 putative glutamine synthetase [Helianthus annuus]KAJ0870286.1 putative glutamine synthetase [Helianthus annuus]